LKAYEATARIEASPDRVWSILVDGSSYTDWDSGVVRLEGQIAPGARLKVTSEANAASPPSSGRGTATSR